MAKLRNHKNQPNPKKKDYFWPSYVFQLTIKNIVIQQGGVQDRTESLSERKQGDYIKETILVFLKAVTYIARHVPRAPRNAHASIFCLRSLFLRVRACGFVPWRFAPMRCACLYLPLEAFAFTSQSQTVKNTSYFFTL